MTLIKLRLALCSLLPLILVGCGGALPHENSSAALHRDLERLVALSEAEGWSIDRVEVEESLPDALDSICRTTPETRDRLKAWLDSEIESNGGDVRAAYQARGKDLDRVDRLLSLTRIRMLLKESMETAEADCPFWVEPSQSFQGRQILDDRWILSFGGGGKGIFVRRQGQNDLNFGGAGRLLLGRAFGRHATVFAGIESGGSAAFPKNEDGEREDLTIAVDTVFPLVYRHRAVNSYWEIEGGYVAHIEEEDPDIDHGLHIGASFGANGKRRRWIFPGAAFGVSYNRIQGERVFHLIKFGFRVAIDVAK